MRQIRAITVLFLGALASACAPHVSEESPIDLAPHIVVLIADDLGLSEAPCHSDEVRMPFLESMCESSLVFERAYTHPYCTASRATFMTGRHPFRHGADDVRSQAKKLPLSEVTIAEIIKQSSRWSYETAAFGKWHLADDENGSERNPNQQGFDYFAGNPRQHHTYNYFGYDWFENGELVGSHSGYKTTHITNSVIQYFGERADTSPQFTIIGFTNPHKPYHAPPSQLHSFGDLPPIQLSGTVSDHPGSNEYRTNRREPRFDVYYHAMLEALDTEIERLVSSVSRESDRPIVFVFVGDNGSAGEVFPLVSGANVRSKATLYDGGVRVPVMAWSSRPKQFPIRTERTDELVHLADFFPTLAGIAGVPVGAGGEGGVEIDGVRIRLQDNEPAQSSSSVRDFVFIERGNDEKLPFAYGGVDRAGLKVILRDPERATNYSKGILVEIYDTDTDPLEASNLLNDPCAIPVDRTDRLFDFIAGKARQNIAHFDWFDEARYRTHIDDVVAECAE